MIEIRMNRTGACESCKKRPAEYSITGGPDEWTSPNRLCQACMFGFVRNNELIRGVLLLQSATRGEGAA